MYAFVFQNQTDDCRIMQTSYANANERSVYPTAMVVNIHHQHTWKDDCVLVPNTRWRVPVVNIPQRPNHSERQTDLNSIIIVDE